VTRLKLAAFLLAGVAFLQAPAAFAQAADPPRTRFEAAFGALWIGRQPLGASSANETKSTGDSTPLFSTSSDLAGAAGIDGRVGVRVTRSLVAEVEASYAKPQLRIAISGDAEGAAATTATETVQQFTVGAGVLWYLPNRGWTPRLAPFAMAGGGYLRQLHDQATLIETGRFYQFGGGATYLLFSSPHFHTKGIGARADVRALIRSKGIAFDGGGHPSPAFGASAFVRF
jgi:hypothetical protein